jgi:MoxR-like ATPase
MNSVNTPTQLRLTHDLLERADALIAMMATDPDVRALGMPTRTAVLRLAIARGLQDLERQYQAPADAAAPRPREGSFSQVSGRRNGSGVSAPAPKGP